MSIAEGIALDAIHTSDDVRIDDEICGKIMRILKEHSPKTSSNCLTPPLSPLCIEQHKFADVTAAIARLVQQEVCKASGRRRHLTSRGTDIVESIMVPGVYGQHLRVPSPTMRSGSHVGSGSILQHCDEPDLGLEEDAPNFASTKVVAEGMMDIALLTANANQLRFLYAFNRSSESFIYSLSLIVASLIIQMFVGIGLLLKNRLRRLNQPERIQTLHDVLVIGVYMVTIINILAATTTETTGPTERN